MFKKLFRKYFPLPSLVDSPELIQTRIDLHKAQQELKQCRKDLHYVVPLLSDRCPPDNLNELSLIKQRLYRA